jgi:hypothetical protein
LKGVRRLHCLLLQVAKLRRQQAALLGESVKLTRQADQITSPANFAQSSKLKRKALSKEKEAAALHAEEVCGCSHVTMPLIHRCCTSVMQVVGQHANTGGALLM